MSCLRVVQFLTGVKPQAIINALKPGLRVVQFLTGVKPFQRIITHSQSLRVVQFLTGVKQFFIAAVRDDGL